MTPQKMIVRVTILALLIMLVSAIAKGVLFHSVLAPDDSGRQPIEQSPKEPLIKPIGDSGFQGEPGSAAPESG